jgi:serine/threonine protein kinase
MESLSDHAILRSVEEDYLILSIIHENATSTLFKARQIDGGQLFVIKSIDSDLEKGRGNMDDKFIALARVQHQTILGLHRIYRDKEHFHLVFEYAPYGDLLEFIEKRGYFSEDEVVRFTRKLLEVIAYMHSVGVVHRDLKPDNIMLDSPYDISSFKVCDFGLAGILTSEPFTLRCGSPGYIAPEILKGVHYDSKVDLFSAGVITYLL